MAKFISAQKLVLLCVRTPKCGIKKFSVVTMSAFSRRIAGKFLGRRTTFLPDTECGRRNGSVRCTIHLETIDLARRVERIEEQGENADANRMRNIVVPGAI